MLVQVKKLQKIQKVHDRGITKFPYKEYSPILNILKTRNTLRSIAVAK